MSIKAVKAIPRFLMKSLFVTDENSSKIKQYVDQFDDVWIISITDPGSNLFKNESDHIIKLEFHDSSPENPERAREELDNGIILFDEAMANKIVNFMEKANQNNKEGNDLLLVNCMMGVSRSGAVVDIARQLFGLDYDEFKQNNPQIVPNVYVKQGLMKALQTDKTLV